MAAAAAGVRCRYDLENKWDISGHISLFIRRENLFKNPQSEYLGSVTYPCLS